MLLRKGKTVSRHQQKFDHHSHNITMNPFLKQMFAEMVGQQSINGMDLFHSEVIEQKHVNKDNHETDTCFLCVMNMPTHQTRTTKLKELFARLQTLDEQIQFDKVIRPLDLTVFNRDIVQKKYDISATKFFNMLVGCGMIPALAKLMKTPARTDKASGAIRQYSVNIMLNMIVSDDENSLKHSALELASTAPPLIAKTVSKMIKYGVIEEIAKFATMGLNLPEALKSTHCLRRIVSFDDISAGVVASILKAVPDAVEKLTYYFQNSEDCVHEDYDKVLY
jgi:hypothetical protein